MKRRILRPILFYIFVGAALTISAAAMTVQNNGFVLHDAEHETGDSTFSFVLSESEEVPEFSESSMFPLHFTFSEPAGIFISFDLPRGWHKGTTRVGIIVTATYNAGMIKVEAKTSQSEGWTDITGTLSIEITDNCTVYVQVTDLTGAVVSESVYVECFDRVKPTVRASRSGQTLCIEASDDLSRVEAIFVDGEGFADLLDGTLEYRLDTLNTGEDRIWIEARDFAGNMSDTVTIANPYYIDPTPPAQETKAESSIKEQPPVNSATTTTEILPSTVATASVPPTSSATSSSTPSSTSASGAPAENATAGAVDTAEEGSGNTAGIITVGDNQFITIETRDGNTFYLIIDGYRSSDNIYLVSEVTTQDLISFIADDTDTGHTGGASPVPDPDDGTDVLIDGGTLPEKDNPGDYLDLTGDGDSSEAGDGDGESEQQSSAEDTPADDEKKPNVIPGWTVIAILALVVAFAGYMFLVVLPRKKAKEAFMDEDDEDMEEDYEDISHTRSDDDGVEDPLDIAFEDEEDY